MVHADNTSSGATSPTDAEKQLESGHVEKQFESGHADQLEVVHTNERVPGHQNYYEKNGLRTYGDEEDHDHEPKMSFARLMSLVAMAFLWTGSQIPVYLFGGVPPYIYGDLGGADRWIWFVLGNLLALAAVCPFVGSLSDLMGRRYVALIGAGLIVIGMIVSSTANTMNNFIGGMAIAGAGAGICELTSLAVASELAPTRKRGQYVAVLIFTILPFCPSVLWGQLIAYHAGWRYIGLVCGVWAFIGFVMTFIFYHPPPRVNSVGLSRNEIITQIDFVGGFFSVAGMLLFIMGLQWGGYQYPWNTAHVLVPLILGAVFLVIFVVWEAKFAKHPMFPKRLGQAPRTLALTLIITFISGANFFSILMFWPTEAFNVYGNDPVGVGLRGLPIGFAILAGACIVLVLLSLWRGRNKELMIVSSILMTAGCAALAIARPDNLYQIWGLLVLAGLGIGGIVVPASIITTIICPDDLIATVAALTLSIRVIGGAIGYCIYYNIFINKFVPNAENSVGYALITLGVFDPTQIELAITAIGNALPQLLETIPQIQGNETAYNMVIAAGQEAFALSYQYVYYASMSFGGLSIIAACFLGDITAFMDDHVAVVMH